MRQSVTPTKESPILIYNDCCPFCSDTAHWLQKNWNNNIVLVPNSQSGAIYAHEDLNKENIKKNVHLITIDESKKRVLSSAGKAVINVLSMRKGFGWLKYLYKVWPLNLLIELLYYILKKTKKYYD